jgi:phosphopantetheine adenylyltransferase/dephospho-CoA kinase
MLLKNSATDGVAKTFDPAKRPFIIGLTGGIASGKTSVSKRLEKLGAARIDCDQLGHQAYAKGSSCFEKVVSAFGNNILCESTGEIDRKKLGPIVFSDPGKLSELNGIVWPAIRAMVLEITREAHESGKEIVVIEAAILLEAEWDDMVDEVWLCVIPEDEGGFLYQD